MTENRRHYLWSRSNWTERWSAARACRVPTPRRNRHMHLREWAGRAGTDVLRRQIARRLDDGVVEVKAVWVDNSAPRHNELTTAMARIFVHAMKLSGVRYAFCTAASHAVPRWQSSGGVVSTDVAPVAYPDDRYLTMLLWWDRQNILQSISSEQSRAIARESSQLCQAIDAGVAFGGLMTLVVPSELADQECARGYLLSADDAIDRVQLAAPAIRAGRRRDRSPGRDAARTGGPSAGARPGATRRAPAMGVVPVAANSHFRAWAPAIPAASAGSQPQQDHHR